MGRRFRRLGLRLNWRAWTSSPASSPATSSSPALRAGRIAASPVGVVGLRRAAVGAAQRLELAIRLDGGCRGLRLMRIIVGFHG